MKKVKDTKYPTLKQMSSISDNIEEIFKTYTSIEISCVTHLHKDTKIEYLFYVEDKHCKYFNSWQELLTFYHKVMKEEVNE